MADLFDVAAAIDKMASGFESEVMRLVCEDPSLAVTAVQEQLYSGLSGDDSTLSPNYDTDPYFDDPQSSWYHRSADYKAWKKSITPPQKGMLLGTPPRGENAPNLYIDGTFYAKIEARPSGDCLTIEVALDAQSSDIVDKWGESILRLGSYAIDYYNYAVLTPGIWKYFENCGW